jgi:hypothetical protein
MGMMPYKASFLPKKETGAVNWYMMAEMHPPLHSQYINLLLR